MGVRSRLRRLGHLVRQLIQMAGLVIGLLTMVIASNMPDGLLETREVVDLGVARYPANAGVQATGAGREAESARHEWKRPRKADWYRVGYAHGIGQARTIEARHEALARNFSVSDAAGDTFSWKVPAQCSDDPWTCVYDQVLEDNADSLGPLVERLERRFRSENWSEVEAARWLLAFVQQIPYRIPNEFAFGILPPSIVASRDWGDCDSKSLLLMAALEQVGIESILLISNAHQHAMVGIAVPAARDTYRYRGREYAWAETTAQMPLGRRDPGLKTPDDWRVVLAR